MCSGDISSMNSRGSTGMSACSIFSNSLLMPFQNISNFGSSNLICAIQCSTYKKIYIGETGNTLRCRMYQHNHHIKKHNKSTMLYNHFKNHDPQKYTHMGLEKNSAWSRPERLKQERKTKQNCGFIRIKWDVLLNFEVLKHRTNLVTCFPFNTFYSLNKCFFNSILICGFYYEMAYFFVLTFYLSRTTYLFEYATILLAWWNSNKTLFNSREEQKSLGLPLMSCLLFSNHLPF